MIIIIILLLKIIFVKIQNFTNKQFFAGSCFYINMADSVVNHVANTQVQKHPLNIGVLNPPNALYKPVLYSDKEANSNFKQISKDIYDKEHSKGFQDKRKTPLSVILTLVAAAAGGGWLVFKKAMKW